MCHTSKFNNSSLGSNMAESFISRFTRTSTRRATPAAARSTPCTRVGQITTHKESTKHFLKSFPPALGTSYAVFLRNRRKNIKMVLTFFACKFIRWHSLQLSDYTSCNTHTEHSPRLPPNLQIEKPPKAPKDPSPSRQSRVRRSSQNSWPS